MPYDTEKTGNSPMAGDMEGAGGDMAGDDAGQKETIHIQSDMLPQGIKEGDCLHCTGMDENGCQFELEKGEGPNNGESWEDGFRKDMSAMSGDQEAS